MAAFNYLCGEYDMNIITKLNIRQRVMLVLTVLAAIFLAWQIYNFVRGNAPAIPAARSTVAPAVPAGPLPAQAPQVRPLPEDLANPALNSHQQEYLTLVREYQVTKMKRQILEEQAGLANAQKRIVDAGKGGTLPYVDSFGGDNSANSGNYQLSYLDRQAGQWTATLSINGQYTEVHVGTHLPDGFKVAAISSRGVVLQSPGGKAVTVGFQGSINNVDNSSPAYAVRRVAAARPVAPVVNNPNNPNNAQIAKMLGITAVPPPPKQATGALTAPVSHDVPAGPLTVTVTPAPSSPAQPAATTPDTNLSGPPQSTGNSDQNQLNQNQNQNLNQSQDQNLNQNQMQNQNPNLNSNPNSDLNQANPNQPQAAATPSEPPPPPVKPVSVKEMRQDIDQLSWQQSADQQDQSER